MMQRRHLLWIPLACALSLGSASSESASMELGASLTEWPGAPSELDEFDELERELRSSNDMDRWRAVQGLVELGSEEAWEAVLSALGDESARVADEAQLSLPTCALESVRESLLSKEGLGASSALVRLRASELVGRMDSPVPFDAFTKPLSDKDPEVRRNLCWSLERLAASGHLEGIGARKPRQVLERIANKDKVSGVRAAALLALAGIDPDSVEELRGRASADKQPEVRAAALWISGEAELRAALTDDDAGVRWVAAGRLAELGTRGGFEALVDALEAEESLRLRWRIVDHLQALSGLKHRLDVRPWRDFLAGLPEGWEPQGGTRRDSEAPNSTAAFAGLPILSDRLSFLIDFSGSMWAEVETGITRKQQVDGELSRALDALGPEVQFNLIPYASEPHPWGDELAEASPRNVKKAKAWFEKLDERGTGDLWSAVLLALEDPRVDSLVVLHDGSPTGGIAWNVELFESLLTERLRFRGVCFDCVLVRDTKFLRRRWDEIASGTGGRFVARDE